MLPYSCVNLWDHNMAVEHPEEVKRSATLPLNPEPQTLKLSPKVLKPQTLKPQTLKVSPKVLKPQTLSKP